MASRGKSRNVGWSTAAEDLLAYYRAYGTRDPEEASSRVRQLTAYFKGWRLADIDASAILGYVNYRKGQGRANATINADLAVLRKTLRVAQELGKLDVTPRVRTLRPAPPRAGFFEADQFQRVCKALPDDLALVVRIGYTLGWRLSSEVLTLTRRQVDLREGTLRLEPGIGKNRETRLAYLTPELSAGTWNNWTGYGTWSGGWVLSYPGCSPTHMGDTLASVSDRFVSGGIGCVGWRVVLA